MGLAQAALTPDEVWGAWNLDPVVMVVVFVALWAHRRGRTSGSGRTRDRRRGIAFGIALVALVVAFVSPVDAMSGALLSAHMVQHVLVLLVAAPLLAFSAPSGVLLRGAPLPVRRAAVSARRAVRPGARWLLVLGGPVAVWLLHVLTVWGWHAAPAYQAALGSGWLHVLEHATFLATGVLFWRVVVGSRSGASRVPGGLGVLLVFGMAMQGVFLSALMTFSTQPWYPAYAGAAAWGIDPLTDQHLAGVLMWIPGSLVYLPIAMTLLVGWLRDVTTDEPDEDPRVASSPAPSGVPERA
ncbi:cytochrome c oxidase assembly protein [Salsipaludibacter albus]|uniref:cytochrome c oxidase assembly protein n=1 Tax=Salsipaludibacter albus TaxID=2849650 RepID=UPI001EE3DCB2|nr:cytochrome c oxidase assembly protein [Salsipaludibacter albus]MBY5164371.1 cytochrome c oxidase assembly protein [Salsipaludibacter albus]